MLHRRGASHHNRSIDRRRHGVDLQSGRRSDKLSGCSWSEAKLLKLHRESAERDPKLRRQRTQRLMERMMLECRR